MQRSLAAWIIHISLLLWGCLSGSANELPANHLITEHSDGSRSLSLEIQWPASYGIVLERSVDLVNWQAVNSDYSFGQLFTYELYRHARGQQPHDDEDMAAPDSQDKQELTYLWRTLPGESGVVVTWNRAQGDPGVAVFPSLPHPNISVPVFTGSYDEQWDVILFFQGTIEFAPETSIDLTNEEQTRLFALHSLWSRIGADMHELNNGQANSQREAANLPPGNQYFWRARPLVFDSDGDGLKNHEEFASQPPTDPFNADTDGDGIPDGEERQRGSDPLKHNDLNDSDGDGLIDAIDAAPNDAAINWAISPDDLYFAIPIIAADSGSALDLNRVGQIPFQKGVWSPAQGYQALSSLNQELQVSTGSNNNVLFTSYEPTSPLNITDSGAIIGSSNALLQQGQPSEPAIIWSNPAATQKIIGLNFIENAYSSYDAEHKQQFFDDYSTGFAAAYHSPRVDFMGSSAAGFLARGHVGGDISQSSSWWRFDSAGAFTEGTSPFDLYDLVGFTQDGGVLGNQNATQSLPSRAVYHAADGSLEVIPDLVWVNAAGNAPESHLSATGYLASPQAMTATYIRHPEGNWERASSLDGMWVHRMNSRGEALVDNASLWRNGLVRPLQSLTSAEWPLESAVDLTNEGLILCDGELPHLLYPVTITTRDRFVAGTLRLLPGFEQAALSFHGPNGEDYGFFPQFFDPAGNSSTLIYDSIDQLVDPDGPSQPENQKIWFVRSADESDVIHFFTAFDDYGTITLALHPDGSLGNAGLLKIPLTYEPETASWLAAMNRIVNGYGLQANNGTSSSVATPALNHQTEGPESVGILDGLIAQNQAIQHQRGHHFGSPATAKLFDPTGAGLLQNQARGLMVVAFAGVLQLELTEAIGRGMLQGLWQGLQDDIEFIELLAGLAGYTLEAAKYQFMQQELPKWRDDPIKRFNEVAGMLHEVNKKWIIPAVVKATAPAPRPSFFDLSPLEKAIRLGSFAANPFFPPFQRGTEKLGRAVLIDQREVIVDEILGWMDSFATSMLEDSEKAVFKPGNHHPWKKDPLLSGMRSASQAAGYSFGFMSGYAIEQIAIGIATGGTVTVAAVLARGGVATLKIAARHTAFAATTRLHFLKISLADQLFPDKALARHIEKNLRQSTLKSTDDALTATPAEVIGTALKKNPAVDDIPAHYWHLRHAVAEAEKLFGLGRTRRLCERFDGLLDWNRQLARLMNDLGDEATNKAFDGALRLTDVLAPLNEGALVDDLLRLDELAEAFVKSGTPEQRKLLREFLELQADRTSQDILENGAKLPPSIKEVFPTMYHYADADTLINFATPQADGKWLLKKNDGGRYVTTSNLFDSEQIRSGLQLPRSRLPIDALTRGRYKCVIQTKDIADDLSIPPSWRHSANGGEWTKQDWLEPLVFDNPERGLGGLPQFT